MNSQFDSSRNRPANLPQGAKRLESRLSAISWILAIAQATFPGATYFLEIAPPFFPTLSLLTAALTIVVFLWSCQTEANGSNLLRRGTVFVVGSIAALVIYLLLLGYTSVAPPIGREGPRIQIGFYMFVLTDKARDLMRDLPTSDPPVEIHTPNDLLNAIGVWGGAGRVDELWPIWTVLISGVVLVVLFVLACGLWSYGLGILLAYFNSGDPAVDIMRALKTTAGHFSLESGYHGNRWHDASALFLNPVSTRAWGIELAHRVRKYQPDVVCSGPEGGALIAQFVAAELGLQFVSTCRFIDEHGEKRYAAPESVKGALDGKRVLVVSDIVSAGTVLRDCENAATQCHAIVVAFASLLRVGDLGSIHGNISSKPYVFLAIADGQIWTADECPLCKSGIAVMDAISISGTEHEIAAIQMQRGHSPDH
jgi:orotate phosphoribosyltransferase